MRWLDNVSEDNTLGPQLLEVFLLFDLNFIFFPFSIFFFHVDISFLLLLVLQLLCACPPEIQKEIISSIPEIIGDVHHADVIDTLQTMLSENPHFSVVILDALSSLSLSEDAVESTSVTVLDLFDSASLDDLPIMIRFLLNHSSKDTAPNIVKCLRQKLNFLGLSSLPLQESSSSSLSLSQGQRNKLSKDSKMGSSRCGPVLIVEALRAGVRFHNHVAATFIQEIQSLPQIIAHKVLDVWVLLMLCRTSFRDKALSLFKKKLEAGMITPALIK